MATTIRISDKLWKILNRLKLRGETFEDVIQDLIKKENQIKIKRK